MSASDAGRRAALLVTMLALYVGGVVLVAGTLSVPLHDLATSAGAHDLEMRRTLYRFAQLVALLGLVPLLALTGGVSAAAFGFAPGPPRRWLAELGTGFAVGLVTLGALAAVLLATGLRVPRPDVVIEPGWLAGVVASAVMTATLVSSLEETWFRGGLHTLIARVAGPLSAIACVAAIYAALHFVRPPSLAEGAVPGPLDGLDLLARSLGRFGDVQIVGPALALLAVGILLGLARLHTGRIAACIGLHAGWVLVIRVLKKTTHMTADPVRVRLVDGYDGVVGWVALAWFAILAALYAWYVLGARADRA